MDSATKDELASRFRAYLDLSSESLEPREGAVTDEPDLYSLLAELGALKSEVKRESRQVKTALDEFRALFEALQAANTNADEERRRQREQERAAQVRERKDLLLELLELRDRLRAGHGGAAGYRPKGLLGRRQARAYASSMAEGLAMNIRRLDETLSRRGVRSLSAVGETFDPHQMHAAELAFDPRHPVGQVIAELRPGFLLDGELLRPAEVVVNRPSDPTTGTSET